MCMQKCHANQVLLLISLPELHDHLEIIHLVLSKKLTFHTSCYAHIRVRIRGLKSLCAYEINDS